MAKIAGADVIRAYGTSVMRDAPQGQPFADQITAKTGIPVRILKGAEEAFYSYIGAAGTSNVLTAVTDIAAVPRKSAWDTGLISDSAAAIL